MAVAKKTTPVAAKKATEPDLLAGLADDTATAPVDENEVIDLLDGLSEGEGTPWIPDDEDDPSPEGIQGTVTYIGSVPSDFGPEDCPIIELVDASGTTWSVRGYATVLRNQISKADPRVGDTMAVKFFGLKASKGGKDYKNFKVVVRRG